MLLLENNHLTCHFDEEFGLLKEISVHDFMLPLNGISFDFGCNGENQTNLLKYESMLEFRTWNLPAIKPIKNSKFTKPISCEKKDNTVCLTYQFPYAELTMVYELLDTCLSVYAVIQNTSAAPLYFNTFSFITKVPEIENICFDFPGNVPIWNCRPSELSPYQVVETGLVNFATHTKIKEKDFNLLFIDPIEKWSCGVYQDGTQTNYIYNAGLEADLLPGKALTVERLYLQLIPDGNPYLGIRDLVDTLCQKPCEDGITEGVMYSCHPAGTMDSNFPLKQDLNEFANYLPKLKAMNIDHIWLLPVFDHNENGVYHSNDQSLIDERYGGEAACKAFCDKAHELGMTVLFDYVPHGPAPEFPLVKDHPEWPAKRRDGSLQDEWECVSMDYNHPGYLEYTTDLVYDHVKRFGIDGARIDCAMGGLSNWRPYQEERPSGNSVRAGIHITEAIREGFLKGGKRSFILPENFHPIPNYYHTTDLFYGMNLYRVFCEIEPLFQTNPTEFVHILTDFLEREALITPVNYHKLRFLGNHDTVSWVWQSRRAKDCYTEDGAKALWAVISLIDGMPMIYQGDEDPSIYNGQGNQLLDYFSELFAARKKYLPKNSNETEYLHTGTSVMAFIRKGKSGKCLVTVNLSSEEQDFDLSDYKGAVCLTATDNSGILMPFSYQIYKL